MPNAGSLAFVLRGFAIVPGVLGVLVVVGGLGGCAIGGRVTGGMMANREEIDPFVGVTVSFAYVAPSADVTLEAGGRQASSGARYATVGARYAHEVRDQYGFTAAAMGAVGSEDRFAQVSGGGLLVRRWLESEAPDARSLWIMQLTGEVVVGVGDPERRDLEARGGFQIGLGFLYVIMR